MTSPCYRCHKRQPTCHGRCPDYAAWRKELEDAKTPPVGISTTAHEKNVENLLRRAVKDRADGRGKHRGE